MRTAYLWLNGKVHATMPYAPGVTRCGHAAARQGQYVPAGSKLCGMCFRPERSER